MNDDTGDFDQNDLNFGNALAMKSNEGFNKQRLYLNFINQK